MEPAKVQIIRMDGISHNSLESTILLFEKCSSSNATIYNWRTFLLIPRNGGDGGNAFRGWLSGWNEILELPFLHFY